MVPAPSSGNDFVVTCFDSVALAQLRDALKFLLQAGAACPASVPGEERYISLYSVSARIKFLTAEASFYIVCFCNAYSF